ncbi:single-stranded DNA-binding protein [Ornithinimicrobium avium]|uniref:Single-stranded DNA-binding protein n=1 Tax=Ornithinimicrobium avium TaxID=2283195 RepID=A0A345NJN7_9MICO|nr:single-stranded DNA-binding protein [Ornithinimicrobium avium]AXH95245.1 single-stranded DNA-binding protein [Ornithinimicrobium avium]
MSTTRGRQSGEPFEEPVNEVHLVGRVSGEPTVRELPSGDELVQFRLVVPRDPRRGRAGTAGSRQAVDTIDVACWGSRVRRSAARLPDGQAVEVRGSLHRRFFAAAAGRASRYEVEARTLRRVELA